MLLFTTRYFIIYSLTFFFFFHIVYLITKNEKEHPRPKFRSFSQLPSHALRAYRTMIRKVTLLCKLNLINISDFGIFVNAQDSISISSEVCPVCKAKHLCSFHAFYERDMIAIENNAIVCHEVTISRVICASCGHTHAIIPDVLIPYGSYSLFFILKVLRLYFLHSYTVPILCSNYGISISTLYAWIRLFHNQKSFWMGALSDIETSSLSFLSLLMDTASFPMAFFHTFHVSFLQQYRFTTGSHLP